MLSKLRQAVYQSSISRALTNVYADPTTEERVLEPDDKIVIFSDHHKGGRNHADDFWRCEAAYTAALGHYIECGYSLYILGDGEELWEEDREKVLSEYQDTLRLEGCFLKEQRYERFFGNHDEEWSDPERADALRAALDPTNTSDLHIREGLRLSWGKGTTVRGRLFLVHGHQGTLESHLLSRPSEFLVKQGWGRVQRMLRKPWNTPSRDHRLRARHDRAMWRWADKHPDRPVLIAGHTHRPVFWSRADLGMEKAEAQAEIESLEKSLEALRAQSAPASERAHCRAKLESARAKLETTPDLAPVNTPRPCYFNTGCCSFADGGVTGLEIADGCIRLVRWPWPYGSQQPTPQLLDSLGLENLFPPASQ